MSAGGIAPQRDLKVYSYTDYRQQVACVGYIYLFDNTRKLTILLIPRLGIEPYKCEITYTTGTADHIRTTLPNSKVEENFDTFLTFGEPADEPLDPIWHLYFTGISNTRREVAKASITAFVLACDDLIWIYGLFKRYEGMEHKYLDAAELIYTDRGRIDEAFFDEARTNRVAIHELFPHFTFETEARSSFVDLNILQTKNN